MSPPTPEQVRTRDRFEALIRLMAPAMDVVLAAGDRLSRIVERQDYEYFPPRAGSIEPPGPTSGVRGPRE